VTTVLQDRPEMLVPIRSYPSADGLDPVTFSGIKWKIWEAARAATAAPVYFKPFEIAGRRFVDAGVGYNNPSIEVYHEITKEIPEYKDQRIACFVSIGTGVGEPRPAPGIRERSGSILTRGADLIQYLSNIASATEKINQEMRRTYMRDG
jgi:predicted acylesterase/phospholipase RssA